VNLADELPCIFEGAVPTVHIQQFVSLDGLLDGQHQEPLAQGRPDCGETACSDLLEDGHDESERTSLFPLGSREVVPVTQVIEQGLIKHHLPFAERESLGMNNPPRKKWTPI